MKNLGLLAIALLTATTLHAQQRALYRDPRPPSSSVWRTSWRRMTQDEKIAQLTAIWTQKNQLFDRDGRFDPAAARRLYPNGIGQFARPGDLQGPGNPFKTPYRDVRQTIELVNAIQRFAAARGSAFRCCFTRRACMAMQPAAPRIFRKRSHWPAAGILHCSNEYSR